MNAAQLKRMMGDRMADDSMCPLGGCMYRAQHDGYCPWHDFRRIEPRPSLLRRLASSARMFVRGVLGRVS